MKDTLKILFNEDVRTDAELIWHELKKNKIEFERLLVDNEKDFLVGLKSFNPDLIISDFRLPQFDGMKALLLRNELTPLTPFILVTGSNNETVAVDCMKAGADDYVLKDNLSRLGPAVINSINKIKLLLQKRDAETALRESEERFRILYNDAVVGLYRTNLEGEILLANTTLVKMLGFQSFEELATRNLKETGYGTSYDRQQFIGQIEKSGKIRDQEAIWICKDGKEIFIRESAKAVYDSEGKIIFFDGTVVDISDRKKAEEALIESEMKYRQMVTRSPDGIFIIDMSGNFLSVNSAICNNLKYTEAELLSLNILDIVPEKYLSLYRQRMESILKGEITNIGAHYDVIGKDGVSYPVEVLSAPFYKGKEIIGYQGIARDIRERQHAEKILRESEEKYRSIFENVQDLYYESAMDGTILEVSPSISAISYGQYNREDLIGKSMYEFYSFPGEREKLVEALISKGSISDFEIKLKNRDGSFIPCSISSKINFDTNGKPLKIIGSMHDISARKIAEDALQQNLAFSESLLKTIPFGMDIVDESGTVLFQSENFKKLFGESAIGKKCWNLYRDDKKQCHDCPLRKGITVGETESYESHGVMGGRIFEINHTGMIYQGKRAMLEIFQDITDRKINEAELISAKENAEESDRLKTAFLHNISHEIRTPMNAIVGFSALLGEPGIDEQTHKSYIEMIMQGSNHLLSIISDIVDISNIEANLVKIAKNEINLNSILKSLYTQFLPNANEKKIKFFCKNGLSDADASIITDGTKLTQIITNLLSNAFKFTDEGFVELEYVKDETFLKFCVHDTGIGIAEEFHKKIFDRFFQVDNSHARLYEGTGLGLAISFAYVQLLGGKMWLSSEPGKGTSFYFTIPYNKQVAASVPVIEKTTFQDFVFKKKVRILIAEDIESNYRLISYFLKEANTELLRAVTGKEAVDMCLSDKTIDLALMDVKMPEMDGYTAVKLIREADIKIPIIAQTAYADDKEKAMESGCSGFIAKPFDKKSLLKVLSEFI